MYLFKLFTSCSSFVTFTFAPPTNKRGVFISLLRYRLQASSSVSSLFCFHSAFIWLSTMASGKSFVCVDCELRLRCVVLCFGCWSGIFRTTFAMRRLLLLVSICQVFWKFIDDRPAEMQVNRKLFCNQPARNHIFRKLTGQAYKKL